jgi:REP element-mobilizing transposase RayT
MSRRYKILDNAKPHFLTICVVHKLRILDAPGLAETVIKSLQYCTEKKGLQLYGYVVMPSHLHLVAQSGEGVLLNDIVRDLKKFLSKRVVEHFSQQAHPQGMLEFFRLHDSAKQEFRVWTKGYHAIMIQHHRMLVQKLHYIHHNPVRSGLCAGPGEWPYSSAHIHQHLHRIKLKGELELSGNTLYLRHAVTKPD